MNMDKYDELIKHLEEKHPLMFGGKYGGVCVGEGWWPIVEALCLYIQHHINTTNERREFLLKSNPYNHKIPDEVPQVVVEQIKEKFGGLRFYYQGGDDVIDGMVRMAEAWASRTCEVCGAPGHRTNDGWVKTLCSEHEEERKLARESVSY